MQQVLTETTHTALYFYKLFLFLTFVVEYTYSPAREISV